MNIRLDSSLVQEKKLEQANNSLKKMFTSLFLSYEKHWTNWIYKEIVNTKFIWVQRKSDSERERAETNKHSAAK